jgi:Cu2+-containing amine oxidase
MHNPLASSQGGGGARGTVLTTKARTTIGNYDYFIQTHFFLDGTIKSELVLTGYMSGSSHIPFIGHPYGNAVGGAFMGGSIHDHTGGCEAEGPRPRQTDGCCM